MSASTKQMEYMNKRMRESYKRYTLAFNKKTQGDVIDYLESNGPTQTTIVRAIRKLIEEEKKEMI